MCVWVWVCVRVHTACQIEVDSSIEQCESCGGGKGYGVRLTGICGCDTGYPICAKDSQVTGHHWWFPVKEHSSSVR